MEPYRIDVSVLCIFFARPSTFSQVFDQVRKARPRRLFLYQDGPRVGREDDIVNIQKCRQIAENIDWECDIYRCYETENKGCDQGVYSAIKWAFSCTNKCIVLEDDVVPSQSLFPFFKELLDKYENDERINMICGMNHLGVSQNEPYSYFFSKSGSIWGWASWKRIIDEWEDRLDFLYDEHAIDLLQQTMGKRRCMRMVNLIKQHKAAYFESRFGSNQFLNSRLNIVPTYNMISNIGVGLGSTHGSKHIREYPKGIRQVFFMNTYDIEFPLKHPKYVIENVKHQKEVERIMGNFNPRHFLRRIESKLRRVFYGTLRSLGR